jgi:hypothetical protein
MAAWARMVLVCTAGAMLAICANHALPQGVGFYAQRYFYPFLPLLLVLQCVGASRIRWRPAVALPIVLGLSVALGFELVDRRDLYGSNCEVIRRLHVDPAIELAGRAPAEWLVAAEAAGATRYFGEHETIDLLGLNNRAIAHLSTDPRERRCFFAALAPRVFVIPDSEFWEPRLRRAFVFHLLSKARVEANTVLDDAPAWTVVTLLAERRPDALDGCDVSPEPSRD